MNDNKRTRHSGLDECYWDTLDNAAKLFPAITSTRSSNVFRFSAVLREEVDEKALQWALEEALLIMPSFGVRLHRGLFWYYFDVNNQKPVVRKESKYPCTPIYRGREKGFLFRVTYYHKRINFELYHVLSDGMGASSFVKTLIYCYFHRIYGCEVPEDLIRREANKVARDFDEDSFVANVPEKEMPQDEKIKEDNAFHISGSGYDGTKIGILSANFSFKNIRALAKENDATLSEYICALLIWSIYNTSYRRTSMKLPIVISMPVNLRGMFNSITLRNFFGHMNVSVKPTREFTFDMTLEAVKDNFKRHLVKGYFEKQISDHVKIERIPGIKFVPLFIKNAVMKYIYSKNQRHYTMTFSNLGKLTLPDNIADKVERFEVMMGGSATHPKKLSLCTYEDNLTLTFSSTVSDNSLEQFFISYIADKGINVKISSNETAPPVNAPKLPKAKKPPKAKKTPKAKKSHKAEKNIATEESKETGGITNDTGEDIK